MLIMNVNSIEIEGMDVSVMRAETVIVGAGAAGMNCAVKLAEFRRAGGVDNPGAGILVVTGGLSLGASRMSGSDKQTYYKMGTSPRVPDTAMDFAKTLTAFGCCHGDTALVEGIGSLPGFYHLCESGVPFPHDPYGAYIGYKTDHDPCERATSAGPKTSRFMSHCLQAKAEALGIEILDKHVVVDFVTDGDGDERRITGLLCIDRSRAGDDDPGLAVFAARNWVLAAGGPGALYATTVYPRGQYGIHGPALAAGLYAANLTEMQYGLASIKFRWNVSGTYMQVIPRIFSTDADGNNPREFLVEYFPDMKTMATNIFLKGYQWPFDAQRITEHRSTLVDMAVHVETVIRGRRVWMDFLRNPAGGEGWEEFSIDGLDAEAREYLDKTGARQDLPIERLEHMNEPAIDIYTENDIDIRSAPLEIAVCSQHMNGGFAVNTWWESNIPRTFVVGEMAGTHGVKRPGGSALNAGQVGAARAAEYIAHVYSSEPPPEDEAAAVAAKAVMEADCLKQLFSSKTADAPKPQQILGDIGDRMTRSAAHLRSRGGVAEALEEAKTRYAALADSGVQFDSVDQLPEAVLAVQQCFFQVAVLKAQAAMFERGAGSRGSHCILDPAGEQMHPRLIDPDSGEPLRFTGENEALRNEILCLAYDPDQGDLFRTWLEAPRPIPEPDVPFETAWAQYRRGDIYHAQ